MAITSDKLASSLSVTPVLAVAGTSSAGSTADTALSSTYFAMRDFQRALLVYRRTHGTGTLAKLQFLGATSSTGANVTVLKSHALGSNPDAVDDVIALEIDASEIREVGIANSLNFTHINGRFAHDTGTNRGVISLVLGDCRNPKASRTTDVVS